MTQDWYTHLTPIQGQHMSAFILSGAIHVYELAYLNQRNQFHCHVHPFREFLYLIHGQLQVQSGEKLLQMEPGDILSIPPETEHLLIPGGKEFAVVQYNMAYTPHSREMITQTPHLLRLKECIGDERYLIDNMDSKGFAMVHDDGSCLRELQNIAQTLERHYTGDYIRTANCMSNLFITTCQNFLTNKVADWFPSVHAANVQRLSNKATQIATYIREHRAQELTAETVAQQFNYSRRHVQRIVMDYYGVSISYLIKFYRVKLVTELLGQKNLPLEELAERCGYSDLRLMSRHFREITGLTVSQYRKLLSIGLPIPAPPFPTHQARNPLR